MNRFKIGDVVCRAASEFKDKGEIKFVFTTGGGYIRYVVEWDLNKSHVYKEHELEAIPTYTVNLLYSKRESASL